MTTKFEQSSGYSTTVRIRSSLAIFAIAGYPFLLISNSANFIGFQVRNMAQAWLVLEITDSTFYVGLVNATPAMILMLLSPFGGVLADRFNRKNIALGGRFVVAVVSFMTAYLVTADLIEIWHLIVMGLILGIGMALSNPASQIIVMDLVGRDRMISAMSLNTTLSNLGTMLGPSIGGVLVAAYGNQSVFILTAAITGVSFFTLFGLPTLKSPISKGSAGWRSGLNDMVSGISYTIKTPSARWLLFTVTGALYWGTIQPIIPYYARDVLQVGSVGYGLLLGVAGAGSMATAIFMFLAGDLPRKGLMILGSVAIISLCYSLFAISSSFPLSLAIMCVSGLGSGVWMTAVFALLQTAVDDNMRGRVMGLALSGIQFYGFGFLIGGFLAETIGAELTLHITAAIWFLSGLLAFVRSPEMRNLS